MHKALTDVTLKGPDSGLIEAVFSTFDVIDKDGDVTLKGAFTEGAPVVISAYGHTSWDGALPIGKGSIHEDGQQAVMRGEFFLNTTHGRDAWETVKQLSSAGLQEWSYSLRDVVSKRGKVDGQNVRIIERVNSVTEVSPVLLGAGTDTRTLSTKSTKFSEHIDTVRTEVDELLVRAQGVMTLRASQGKSIAPASVAALDELVSTVERLKELMAVDRAPDPEVSDTSLDELAAEYLRFVAFTQGVIT